MCGIVGYVGSKPAASVLFEGLRRLEYRGYDSSGIAVLNGEGEFFVEKAAGKLSSLISAVGDRVPDGRVGIGHTRWATHGKPTASNAHPHLDCHGEIAVIHNGIVENYRPLKKRLLGKGHVLTSDTDTEVIAHMVEEHCARGDGLQEAVGKSLSAMEGAYSLLVMSTREPDKIVAARVGNAGGIVVGYGEKEVYLASDLPAIAPYTNRAVFLENGDIVSVSPEGARYFNKGGEETARKPRPISHEEVAVAKGGYKHFMLKEIMEQSQAITNVLRERVTFDPPEIALQEMPFSNRDLAGVRRVVLVGMGTSLHAAMVGRVMIEELARIPAEVDNASEFRYRDPIIDASTLVVSISQSGETVDTLAAMEEARRKGARQVAICNIENSQASRLADYTLYIRAGLEIGVCSTKCLVNSMAALYLLAAHIGRARGNLAEEALATMVDDLARLPSAIGEALDRESQCQKLAQSHFRINNFLYLGRGVNYPTAMEGALKLKEMSYSHAEGYQAGEMKHGPIALIDENMPVVAIALKDRMYPKMLNNIEEVKARDGRVIALATEGDDDIGSRADHVIYLPTVPYLLSPLLSVVPLQLFAYHIAVRRGCDVDQPRNLAKTVTVE
ncbi:MAG: glutamine--fructose-6-phosphate transaminase (isomerizing) [Dehalococcoidia bacterium]